MRKIFLLIITVLFIFGCSKQIEIDIDSESSNEYITKILENKDPLTGKEMPQVKITIKSESAEQLNEIEFGIFAMPSIKDDLIERGYLDEHPKMRVIGPFYQIFPKGESFGTQIKFNFCYFDEDVGNYNENLFYIAEETNDVWKNIGGTPKPEENCVEIILSEAPNNNIAVYADIE